MKIFGDISLQFPICLVIHARTAAVRFNAGLFAKIYRDFTVYLFRLYLLKEITTIQVWAWMYAISLESQLYIFWRRRIFVSPIVTITRVSSVTAVRPSHLKSERARELIYLLVLSGSALYHKSIIRQSWYVGCLIMRGVKFYFLSQRGV